jgi:hypothetical protein
MPPADTTLDVSAQQQEAMMPSKGSNGCDHPYFPLRAGHSITYQSNVAGRTVTYSQAVTEANADHAKMEYTFGTSTKVSIDIECSADGIRGLSNIDMSGMLGGQSTVKSTTKSAQGSILPKDFRVGSEWSGSFESEVEIDNEMMKKAGITHIESTNELSHKAVAAERVTVPAGTYDTIKVETTTKVMMKMSPTAKPTELTTTTVEYWAKDVGLVKSVNTTQNSTWTMEATKVVN